MADNLITVEAIENKLTAYKNSVLSEATKAAGDVKAELEAKIKSIEEAQSNIKGLPEGIDVQKMHTDLEATIKGFNEFQAKNYNASAPKKILSFSEAMGVAIEKVGGVAEIEKALKNPTGAFSLQLGPVDLKAQGSDMTTANTITGDPVVSYNQRQAIIPAQKVNFRDLVPTVSSPTGTYVTYSEDSGETNNITTQTEGNTKGENQYTMTENKLTNPYIAGFSVFTKQLLKNLPFLQTTLTRMLLRDYYKVENASFFTTVSQAATGPTSMGSSPDDVKQLIALIAGQLATNFNASYIVVNPATLGRIITSTYTSGYYSGAGSVIVSGNQISIFGVPVLPASWVTANYALLVDADYLERVEVEGLNIAFSYEDSTNFRQNKVTARIECQTAINLMLPQSACYANLGAS